jgi:hypothetical protein
MPDLESRIQGLEKQLRLWRLLTLLALVLCICIPVGWVAMEGSQIKSRSFVIEDKFERHRAVFSCADDGSPSLVFYDQEGKIVSLLAAKPDGGAEFGLYDNAGRTLFKAPAQPTKYSPTESGTYSK